MVLFFKKRNKGDNGVNLKIALLEASLTNDLPGGTYAVGRINGYRFSTELAPGKNPVWTGSEFNVSIDDWTSADDLEVMVWNRNDRSKTFIGVATLEASSLFLESNYSGSKAHVLKLSNNDGVYSGTVQLKVALTSADKDQQQLDKIWQGLFHLSVDDKQGKFLNDFDSEVEDDIDEFVDGYELDDSGASTQTSDAEDNGVDYSAIPISADGSRTAPPSSLSTVVSSQDTEHLTPLVTVLQQPKRQRRTRRLRNKKLKRLLENKKRYFEFSRLSEVVGIVYIDIESASNLPPLPNMTHTGYDVDPFVVVSFGKKIFRTPHRRHTLDPVFNEKLIFPVHMHERGYDVQFTVMDKDKFTGNDFVAEAMFPVKNILTTTAPQPDENGLFPSSLDINGSNQSAKFDYEMKEFKVPLVVNNKKFANYTPVLKMKAKFLPYAYLRQQFWRRLAFIYDVDKSGSIDLYELNNLLDSLGSTLSEDTLKGFFTQFGKTEDMELSTDELVLCLEKQILEDSLAFKEKQYASQGSALVSGTASTTPGTPVEHASEEENSEAERVVQISECPVCRLPRLRAKAEIDIVTHLATCASQYWSNVDNLLIERFVTASQARRKWYSKVVSKVSYGNYKIGANSAMILVQDRVTGCIAEEKMSAYVRLGMRYLYKGLKSSRMESKRIRDLLKSMSIKQGRKYDNPRSASSIEPFIKYHNIYMGDVLQKTSDFKTFNEFFYRKLKPTARPCDAPDDKGIIVSAADCRFMCFPTISMATEIWVKGKEFNLERLFGKAYPNLVKRFDGGSMGIFRLAPQDYHRFHVPVDGVLGNPRKIEGEYYTVNPMAIRSSLDVYGENVRVLVPIESDELGLVMVVCVGAMMVGSTVITAPAGSRVSRTDELGFFKFGGSTLLLFFEQGKMRFDSDLLANSCADPQRPLETLIRVGMSIGHHVDKKEHERHDKTAEVTDEQREMAGRLISGAISSVSTEIWPNPNEKDIAN